MSDMWKTLEERLKEKAKTTNEILAYIHDLQGFVSSKLVNAEVLIKKGKELWIRLEDVQRLFEQMKSYVLIERETLESLLWTIKNEPSEVSVYIPILEELLKNE